MHTFLYRCHGIMTMDELPLRTEPLESYQLDAQLRFILTVMVSTVAGFKPTCAWQNRKMDEHVWTTSCIHTSEKNWKETWLRYVGIASATSRNHHSISCRTTMSSFTRMVPFAAFALGMACCCLVSRYGDMKLRQNYGSRQTYTCHHMST